MPQRDDSMTDERLDSLELWRDDIEKRWKAAFPGGDHDSHRRYHELMIEDIAEKRALRKAILEKTIAGAVWSLLFVIGLAMWKYLLSMIRGGA